jgi:hypothetical protein
MPRSAFCMVSGSPCYVDTPKQMLVNRRQKSSRSEYRKQMENRKVGSSPWNYFSVSILARAVLKEWCIMGVDGNQNLRLNAGTSQKTRESR